VKEVMAYWPIEFVSVAYYRGLSMAKKRRRRIWEDEEIRPIVPTSGGREFGNDGFGNSRFSPKVGIHGMLGLTSKLSRTFIERPAAAIRT